MDEQTRFRSPSEARAAYLADARRFAARRRPTDLRRQWHDDPSVRPSPLDLRTATAYDAIALEAAAGYDAVLLSPVTPLGTNSVVSPTSQDRAITTTRTTEVVSDPTNVLAIEAAARLTADARAHVRLTTVHQTLRPQPVTGGAGRSAHFRLFALADAGRGEPDDGFEVRAVAAQIAVHLRTIRTAAERFGIQAGDPVAIVRVDASHTTLGDRVSARLTADGVAVVREPLNSGYYAGLRVGVRIPDRAGAPQEIIDVGAFDWVAQLTQDRRHRFVASGFGIQLLPLIYSPA